MLPPAALPRELSHRLLLLCWLGLRLGLGQANQAHPAICHWCLALLTRFPTRSPTPCRSCKALGEDCSAAGATCCIDVNPAAVCIDTVTEGIKVCAVPPTISAESGIATLEETAPESGIFNLVTSADVTSNGASPASERVALVEQGQPGRCCWAHAGCF